MSNGVFPELASTTDKSMPPSSSTIFTTPLPAVVSSQEDQPVYEHAAIQDVSPVLPGNRCENRRTAAWRGEVDQCRGGVLQHAVHRHYLEEVVEGVRGAK